MTFLIFPLGNPGEKYAKTRHNAGRLILSFLKDDEDFKKLLEDSGAKLFIPDSFMNESGKALKSYLKNTNLEKENLIVIYDDKDLEIGDVRLAIDRGDGGHNGLKNIIQNLGGKSFYRIRIGIAPKGTGKNNLIPPHGDIVQKYVLGKFTSEEIDVLKDKKLLERVRIFLEKIILN